jgi:O-methyltransferase
MDDRRIIEICSNYSMISRERLMANINAVRDVQRKQIPGCIVECGVWKGGSLLSMILAAENEPSLQMREFHAYDTFEGMTPPTHLDKDFNG